MAEKFVEVVMMCLPYWNVLLALVVVSMLLDSICKFIDMIRGGKKK